MVIDLEWSTREHISMHLLHGLIHVSLFFLPTCVNKVLHTHIMLCSQLAERGCLLPLSLPGAQTQ